MEQNKVVAAVCHGVLLLSRSKNANGRSLLHGRKTTALLKKQEILAYNLTRLWMGDYYLTYPETTVEDEIIENLESREDFIHGPLPISRDSIDNLSLGFTYVDGNYISARWPGDIYNFSNEILNLLDKLQTKGY